MSKRQDEMREMKRVGYSFSEIGDYFGISRQRVSQLIGTKTNTVREQSIGQLFTAYNFIVMYYAEHGYVPTIREIVDNTDYSSTSSANLSLRRLELMQWIKREEFKGRGYCLWRITERGLSPEAIKTLLEAQE